MTGIYKITNPKKKIYIGQSVNIHQRFRRYRNFECQGQPKLHNSFRKYGIENHIFEIIVECDISQLNEMERYYQELFNVIKQGLNCLLTKTATRSGHCSTETRAKISKAHIGKVVSDSTREKLRIINTGKSRPKKIKPPKIKAKRVLTEITKEKIRQSLTGRKRPKEFCEKIRKALTGKKLPQSVKDKISKNSSRWNLGKKFSSETIKKMSDNNGSVRPVVDTNTGIVYKSIKNASDCLNINYNSLRNMVCGRIKNKTTIKYLENGK